MLLVEVYISFATTTVIDPVPSLTEIAATPVPDARCPPVPIWRRLALDALHLLCVIPTGGAEPYQSTLASALVWRLSKVVAVKVEIPCPGLLLLFGPERLCPLPTCCS